MKHCTRCGTDLTDSVVFCSSCGQRVGSPSEDSVVTSPAQAMLGTAQGPTRISSAQQLRLEFCVKCGSHIAPEADYCSSCGTSRKEVAEPLRSIPGADTRAQNAMIIEIVAGIFGLLGVGHMYSGRTGLGVMLLFGWWIGLAVLVLIGTTGIGLCISLPVGIAVPIFSGFQVRDYVRSQG